MANRNGKIFKDFEDLFRDKNDVQYCIETLRIVVPALISDRNEYLLKSKKGPLIAWKDVLESNGYMYLTGGHTFVKLLNRKIKNLDMKEDSLRLDRSRVYLEYKMQFKQFIKLKDASVAPLR